MNVCLHEYKLREEKTHQRLQCYFHLEMCVFFVVDSLSANSTRAPRHKVNFKGLALFDWVKEKGTLGQCYSLFSNCPQIGLLTSLLVSSCILVVSYHHISGRKKNLTATKNIAEAFSPLASWIFFSFFPPGFYVSPWLQKNSSAISKAYLAGKNGTHFAHHSSRTAHTSVFLGSTLESTRFNRFLLSDEREYNRGKVLLSAYKCRVLAFSGIFTNYFRKEAIFLCAK